MSYAGQAWIDGLIGNSELSVGAALALIGRDLDEDARRKNVDSGPIELWANAEKGSKGFFMGDTTPLPEQGWELVGTL